MRKPIITVIGGGGGVSKLLYELKEYPVSLNAIISMADSGGSTGKLREQYGISAVGDIRKSIAALATKNKEIAQQLSKRHIDGEYQGHTIGNLMLCDLELKLGSIELAIQEMNKMFAVQGNVIAVTLGKPTLVAKRYDGTITRGEANIDTYTAKSISPIQSIWLEPSCNATTAAINAINESDLIVIGPGDFYTSIIPNFLVNDIANAMQQSRAKKAYIGAFVTKENETHNFTSHEYIKILESYIGKGVLDYALFNATPLTNTLLQKYAQTNAKPVHILQPQSEKKPILVAEDFIDQPDVFPINGAKKLSKKLVSLI